MNIIESYHEAVRGGCCRSVRFEYTRFNGTYHALRGGMSSEVLPPMRLTTHLTACSSDIQTVGTLTGPYCVDFAYWNPAESLYSA